MPKGLNSFRKAFANRDYVTLQDVEMLFFLTWRFCGQNPHKVVWRFKGLLKNWNKEYPKWFSKTRQPLTRAYQNTGRTIKSFSFTFAINSYSGPDKLLRGCCATQKLVIVPASVWRTVDGQLHALRQASNVNGKLAAGANWAIIFQF